MSVVIVVSAAGHLPTLEVDWLPSILSSHSTTVIYRRFIFIAAPCEQFTTSKGNYSLSIVSLESGGGEFIML